MRFAGLIAAAGRSLRMGRSKALLPIGEQTFVTQLAGVLSRAGALPVIVTVPEPPDDEEVVRALFEHDVVTMRNRAPADGLSGSVSSAIMTLPDEVQALVLCPVDMPFVTGALVKKLLGAIDAGALAAIPVVGGARGHPVAFSRALFAELCRCASTGLGPRGVLAAHDDDAALVPWGDPRVLENVNTPEDYDRLVASG